MSKKKRFGISEALSRGISETISLVENNQGTYRAVVLPLSRIELDPENPRKLAIDLNDVRMGLRPDDTQYQRKQEELEKLKELAHTIKSSGVINPIVAYKNGEHYRIVAGERRCLASLLAGKQEIDARIFNEKPHGFELKLIQWIENTAREDLTLSERLGNVKEIVKEYQIQNPEAEMSATLLKFITGLSLSQTSYYLSVISAPADVLAEIDNGNINNLDKAALIAGINAEGLRKQAIEACMNGSSLKELRSIIQQQKTLQRSRADLKAKTPGKKPTRINMGSTAKSDVIRTLVASVLEQAQFKKYASAFSQTNWQDLRDTTKAFKKLIQLMESEVAV